MKLITKFVTLLLVNLLNFNIFSMKHSMARPRTDRIDVVKYLLDNNIIKFTLENRLQEIRLQAINNQINQEMILKAVIKNDSGAVKYALEHGANPNAKNAVGTPVLIIAIVHGNISIIKSLLKYKADPNITIYNTSALMLSRAVQRSDIEALLKSYGALDKGKITLNN